MEITALRTTRALPMPAEMPRMMMICSTPRPNVDRIVSSSNSPGNDSQASTNRWMMMSSLPPTKPLTPPTSSDTTRLTEVAAMPTQSESRAP